MASEQARRLAEMLGDDAFLPAAACPHGHKTRPGVVIGDVCWDCAYADAEARAPFPGATYNLAKDTFDAAQANASSHPEWRIGRGEPKPLDMSFDTLEPFLVKVLDHSGMMFSMFHVSIDRWRATFQRHGVGTIDGFGPKPAAATVAAMLEVADRWCWGKEMISP